MEWGIFAEDCLDYSSEEAMEDGFSTKEEAEAAIKERYDPDDDLHAHVIEESDEEDEDEEDEDDDEEDDEEDEDE